MLRGVLRGGACRPAGQAVRDTCPQGNQRVTWGPKPVPEEGKLLPAWVSQEDFLEEEAAGLAGTTGQPPLCSNYLPARVFDSSDSIGATRSTAQQPTPGPPNILWERPGLRAALRRGWGPCSSCRPLPPHLAHPGAAESSAQRETTCGESWCRSRARGLARNCLPLSFPNHDLCPPLGPAAPTARGLPTKQDSGCYFGPFRGPSQEGMMGRGVSDLMFFCL